MEKIKLAGKLKILLDERFPGNYRYVPLLADILGVHEKTVHSKLRGDTQFTLPELYTLSKKLDIPVCEIFRENDQKHKHPMEMYVHDFSPSDRTLVPEHTIEAFRLAASSDNSKYLVATDTLPDVFVYEHENIAKFNYMKWLYFNRGRDETPPLSGIRFTEAERSTHRQYCDYVHKFKRQVYILNIDMMRFIRDKILFFFNINLLAEKEVEAIVRDYCKVIRSLEEICNSGANFSDEREVHVFYSHILLSNDISIVESDQLNFAMIPAYFHNPVVTTGNRTYKVFRNWFASWMHSANIISASDPIQRMKFFARQNKYLAELKEKIAASRIPG